MYCRFIYAVNPGKQLLLREKGAGLTDINVKELQEIPEKRGWGGGCRSKRIEGRGGGRGACTAW